MDLSVRSIVFFGSVALGMLALGPPRAQAVDGVVEINQAKVLSGGVTSADAAGFPVTLGEGGSYRLTGNLQATATDVNAVNIAANDVTLDLNGFTIEGPGQGIGSAKGIFSAAGNVRILNGTVTNFPGHGIHVTFGAFVDHVRAITNGGDGINVGGSGARVTNCTAAQNLDDGIRVRDQALVAWNTAEANGGNGIHAGQGCTLIGNTAANNQANGILADSRAVIKNNTASFNTLDGIHSRISSVVHNSASNNSGDGIEMTGFGTVLGNTAAFNTGYGLRLINATGYASNAASGNVAGQVLSGLKLGANICGTSLCP